MIDSYLTLAITGFVIGFSTALSPGPLMALVVRETLARGFGAGALISLVPIPTDMPIIAVAVIFSRTVPMPSWVLGIIALCGAALICRIGWQNLHACPEQLRTQPGSARKSLFEALMVNLLNPYPYIFWFTLATPLFARVPTGLELPSSRQRLYSEWSSP